MRTMMLAIAVGVAGYGCASGASGGGGNQQVVADSSPRPSEALVGDWNLAADPPLQPPGWHMRVTIDSARGSSFFGRLTYYFAGNVGGDLSAFEPFVGNVNSEGGIAFTIRQRDPAMLGIGVEGRLVQDTIFANTLVVGPDTVTTMSERRWLFVKRR